MRLGRNDSKQAKGFLRATGVVLALALPPVMAAPSPAPAQAVQLVKVDVAVVDKGLRASKLIGQSIVKDDRPEFRGMIQTVRHLVTVEEVD